MKEGIIIVDKPAGWTSHDCVARLRRLTGIKRIGHTGTLDPQATGVLPMCIGSAARIMEYLDLDFKTYRCEMQLGFTTETQDVWGKTVSDVREELLRMQKSGDGFTEEQIREAFSPFHDVVEQVPPKYSALRVEGRRLYEYARAGETVEIKKRKIFIRDLSVLKIDLDRLTVTFEVTCSKGTYVRTICHDIGAALGCGSAMSSLVRIASGAFLLADAISLSSLSELSAEELEERVLPPDFPLVHFGKAFLGRNEARRFSNGETVTEFMACVEKQPEFFEKEPPFPIREEYIRAYNMYERAEERDFFLGVAFFDPLRKQFKADKIFKGSHSE